MKVESLNCPNCTAPLPYSPGQTAAICLYCNASIRLTPDSSSSRTLPQVTHQAEIPADVIERVKQLIVDGKRAEAIQHYQTHAGITYEEAETAVDKIVNSLIWQLTKAVPLNAGGMIVSLLLILLSGAGIVWSVLNALDAGAISLGQGFLAFVSAAIFVAMLRWFIPKMESTLVAGYGKVARATILKTALIRHDFRRDGVLVVLLLEVQPEGQPSFHDQETMLIYKESLPKIQPGNVIQVRFNPGRQDRVFPISPIKAWDPAAGDFV